MPADAGDFALLEHAQQPHLRGERHLADFIEKDRAVISLLEDALMLRAGVGEGPLFVPEEFIFQQVFGDGAAVERAHGVLASDAVAV